MRYCLSLCVLFLISCTKPSPSHDNSSKLISTDAFKQKGVIEFIELEWDFGDIKEGEKVEHLFTFVNSGQSDLIITDAKGSCGCTVPNFPRDPIKAGEKSGIMVVFDSKDRAGKQTKTVTVYSNTDPMTTELTIRANVN